MDRDKLNVLVNAAMLAVGIIIGILFKPVPIHIAGYYVRDGRGGYTYVQHDPNGPLLPGIAANEIRRPVDEVIRRPVEEVRKKVIEEVGGPPPEPPLPTPEK